MVANPYSEVRMPWFLLPLVAGFIVLGAVSLKNATDKKKAEERVTRQVELENYVLFSLDVAPDSLGNLTNDVLRMSDRAYTLLQVYDAIKKLTSEGKIELSEGKYRLVEGDK